MKKPYVICHMLTSIEGKIDGEWMSSAATSSALAKYGALRNTFDAQATLYGTVTMLGSYSDGLAPDLAAFPELPFEDYVAESDVHNYIISVDPKGTLGFDSKYIEKKGRAKAHIIQVLTKEVDRRYLGYLKSRDISYIFADSDALDCKLMLEKLYEKFKISRMILAGGGYMNWSLVQDDLVDEISIVIAPVTDGNTKSVSCFEKYDFLPYRAPAVFRLKEVQVIEGDGVWLRYTLK